MAFPDSRLAALLFSAAFLVRLISWLGAAIFGTDGTHYLLMADWMAQGRFGEALSIGYHPLYPLLIAIAGIPLGTVNAAGLVSVTFGAAAVAPLFWMIREIFGRPEAFVAALLYAFNPVMIEAQSDVLTEGTFTFFFVSSMALTWRAMGESTLARAVALGAAAAAAFLTRPEGLLAIAVAVGWPLVEAIRRRDERARRVANAGLTLLVAGLLIVPYLLWIKSVKGHWGLSARPSVDSAVRSAALLVDSTVAPEGGESNGYVSFFKSILRITYVVTIPFYAAGFFMLRRLPVRGMLFYLSVPFAYVAAILFTLRVHSFMSYRYLIAPTAVLTAVAALGMTGAIRWAARWRPGAKGVPMAGAVGIALLAVLPCIRTLQPSRRECLSYPEAARWMQAHGTPRAVSGPVQQVAYLMGCRSVYSALTSEGVRLQVARERVGYYVYTEKDFEKRPAYVRMLQECDALDPPVEIVGPPGTLKVYVQKSR